MVAPYSPKKCDIPYSREPRRGWEPPQFSLCQGETQGRSTQNLSTNEQRSGFKAFIDFLTTHPRDTAALISAPNPHIPVETRCWSSEKEPIICCWDLLASGVIKYVMFLSLLLGPGSGLQTLRYLEIEDLRSKPSVRTLRIHHRNFD